MSENYLRDFEDCESESVPTTRPTAKVKTKTRGKSAIRIHSLWIKRHDKGSNTIREPGTPTPGALAVTGAKSGCFLRLDETPPEKLRDLAFAVGLVAGCIKILPPALAIFRTLLPLRIETSPSPRPRAGHPKNRSLFELG
jgi:hypothetical protein